ncbi:MULTISPECIES: BfmA/BtgA family mobilization protein [Flavobacteriaceae]|uniref:BfmA/BtgA family mobilization protein n=1 Tax=Flavobacteriaceae TaxID=49546 RepID=UPI001492889E|nr:MULTISPECIES: BfmA/BtgA family mobilization protein [Allomuricauda]MDC6367550.1 BfmA/BtgA family mobilization protein [Muricauda sp. AC10]
MIVKGKYRYSYSTINLKTSVAKRFRAFSKRVAPSHSETLQKMMDFFQRHGIDPSDRSTKGILDEIQKNRKRMEAAIAIIRDIEITQTKPTNAILHALLEQKIKDEPVCVEPKPMKGEPEIEIIVPRIRYERLMDKMGMLKRESQYVMDHITLIKPSFGKPYLKLEITEGELENYKRTLQNL